MSTVQNEKVEKLMNSSTKSENLNEERRAFINEIFEDIAIDCKWHCIDELEIEVDEEIIFSLSTTEEYLAEYEAVWGVDGSSQVFTRGRTYYDASGIKKVVIQGHKSVFGMDEWMTDFYKFSQLVYTIMGLCGSDRNTECVVRDREFAKEQFDALQERLKKIAA